jgi:trehalose-6-phosphate synthase
VIEQLAPSEELSVASLRKIGPVPSGGVAEALSQSLSHMPNGNGNGHYEDGPTFDKVRWYAWDGEQRSEPATGELQHEIVTTETGATFDVIGIPLEQDEYNDYYLGYANSVLWPLNHGYVGKVDRENAETYWRSYVEVNRKFAETMAPQITAENLVWFQDYQLVLGAKYLREELDKLGVDQAPPMALFVHTPIATRDDFAYLPTHQRKELLEGYLSHDLIGFHTEEYVQDFRQTIRRFLPDASVIETPQGLVVNYNGRRTIVDISPIGVDPRILRKRAKNPEVLDDADAIRAGLGDTRMIFNAARRDYMKGFPEGLDAIRELYRNHEETRETSVYVQGDQPSRSGIKDYDEIDGIIDSKVNAVSDEFKTATWPVPIARFTGGFKRNHMYSREMEADVLFITSTRDGFNLVVPEFFCLNRRNGVAVVSDRVGATAVYSEHIVQVNIFNARETAEGLAYALNMPEQERADLMEGGKKTAEEYSVQRWANRHVSLMRRIKTGWDGN